ncbi:Protein of unknown function [Gryllus bimaculatus]|nr:Protein of unknown function [Gryllus bimaculatus]
MARLTTMMLVLVTALLALLAASARGAARPDSAGIVEMVNGLAYGATNRPGGRRGMWGVAAPAAEGAARRRAGESGVEEKEGEGEGAGGESGAAASEGGIPYGSVTGRVAEYYRSRGDPLGNSLLDDLLQVNNQVLIL